MFLQNANNTNFYEYQNPVSADDAHLHYGKAILNYDSIPSSYKNPAVFITNKSKFSYESFDTNNNTKLNGSIIFYKTNDSSNIINYYSIDKDGNKSELYEYTIE